MYRELHFLVIALVFCEDAREEGSSNANRLCLGGSKKHAKGTPADINTDFRYLGLAGELSDLMAKNVHGRQEEPEYHMLATVFTVVCLLDEWKRTIGVAFPEF